MIFLRLFTGYLIQVVPFTVLAMYPFAHCFRRPKKKTVCLTAALVAGLACVFSVSGCLLYSFLPHDTVLFDAVNLIFLMTLIPCFLWLLAAAKAEAFQKLFVFSFTLTCALAMVSVSNAITTMLYLDTADGLPYQGLTPWILLAFSAAALPALLLLLKRCYLPVAGSLDSKSGRYLAFLSLALFLILASGLSFIDYENLYNPMSAFLFTALLVTVFVIYFIYFRMLFLMNENTRAQQRNSELQHQIALQNEQYKRLNENIENSRRMAHDVRHQLVTLSGFLNDGKIGEAKEYLKENIKEMENYEICRFCDIPAINWVVGYYQLAAKEKGISFSIRIFTPPFQNFRFAIRIFPFFSEICWRTLSRQRRR